MMSTPEDHHSCQFSQPVDAFALARSLSFYIEEEMPESLVEDMKTAIDETIRTSKFSQYHFAQTKHSKDESTEGNAIQESTSTLQLVSLTKGRSPTQRYAGTPVTTGRGNTSAYSNRYNMRTQLNSHAKIYGPNPVERGRRVAKKRAKLARKQSGPAQVGSS
ncbi:hypothetical protein TWF481_002911 [Arthrobotrys musiformis]|uniref:Uncharacterized protein n=1 Tax=Arthrobotrys musiformis TaxID=47236 RepID=A0AAV9VTK7_9PEZI